MASDLTMKIEELAEQQKEFHDKLEKHITLNISNQKRDKYLITRQMKETALSLLKVKKGSRCSEGARLKFWVHEKFYPYGPNGTVLRCKKTHKPVAVKEDLFHLIHDAHCRIGHKKKECTWREISSKFSYIKRDVIDIYITTCKTCRMAPVLWLVKPITTLEVASQGFMTRIVVSIVNMEDMPDGEYKYILLLRDCATKFVTAWPLKEIDGGVSTCLLQHFGQFGPAKFVHFVETESKNLDVGKEIGELKWCWPNLTVLEGEADHPDVVGTGERVCADLQNKLGAWMAQVDNDSWSKGLGSSVFLMNSSVSTERDRSPFQAVFGQRPVESDAQWKAVAYYGYKKECDVPKGLRDDILLKDDRKQEVAKSSTSSMSGIEEQATPGSENEFGQSPFCKITDVQSGSQYWNMDEQTMQEDSDIDLDMKVENIKDEPSEIQFTYKY